MAQGVKGMQELEKLGQSLLNGEKGEALRGLAASAEGRALEEKLGGDRAEQAVRSGDVGQMRALLKDVLGTAEGQNLLRKLSDLGF